MNKKIVVMGVLAAFLFQTQAMAAMSKEAEREILSGTSQKSIPNKDKKAPSYRVIWSRQEDDKVKMDKAEREREILGNARQAVSVPVDSEDQVKKKRADKKKKADKKKAEQARQQQGGVDSAESGDTQGEMHSSSMAWDNPNVSKNTPEETASDELNGSGDKNQKANAADKKAKKKKAAKKHTVSQAERERDILGSKGNRTW